MDYSELEAKILGIDGIEIDSRNVKVNYAFFCLKGEHVDGHDFIDSALSHGASVVVASDKYKDKINSEKVVFVSDVRDALAYASTLHYKKYTQHLDYIGVTGTNGKTSVTNYLAQLLSMLTPGEKFGLIGTNGKYIFKDGKQIEEIDPGEGRTTPQAHELHSDLERLGKDKVDTAIMEVSSHALEQKRVAYIPYKVAAFTNLTQDHLDYHITMDKYFEAKAILFENLRETDTAVINLDDQWSGEMLERINEDCWRIVTYSLKDAEADIYAHVERNDSEGIFGRLFVAGEEYPLELTNLKGEFNLYNMLCTLGIAMGLEYNIENCLRYLPQIKPVQGRFEIIEKPEKSLPTCIVDYAHTPDGLENVLQAVKPIVPKDGQLICIFGCGGDRDPSKRPLMGQITTKYADQIIVSNDNPRTEDPEQIAADIIAGIPSLNNVKVELNRTTAIHNAINNASDQDIILIAGKGHETYQIMKDETLHHDDAEEVSNAYNLIKQK